MLSKMVSALVVVALVAIGAKLMSGSVKLTPLSASSEIPTFAQHARGEAPVVQTSTGSAPWATFDRAVKPLRTKAQKEALKALEAAASEGCRPGQSRRLAAALGAYLGQRGKEESAYESHWGDAGAQFIRLAWSTAADQKIGELARNAYRAGQFVTDDLDPDARQIGAQVFGFPPVGRARCG